MPAESEYITVIKAIASLWLIFICIVLALVVLLVAFNKNFRDTVSRIKIFQLSGLGKYESHPLEIENNNQPDQVNDSTVGVAAEPEKLDSEKPSDPNEHFLNLIIACHDGEFDKAALILEAIETSGLLYAEKTTAKAYLLYRRYLANQDKSAMSELHAMEANPRTRYWGALFMGRAHRSTEDYTSAALAFASAAVAASTPSEQSDALVEQAECIAKISGVTAGTELLYTKLGTELDSDALYTLHTGLAAMYRNSDRLMEAIHNEAALMHRPNDRTARFNAAYAYSEADLSQVAVKHYGLLLRLHPEHGAAHNNLGVALEKLGLLGRSVAEYQLAAEKGETLAMANLANNYMNSGFIKEAKEMLDQARIAKEVNPQVGIRMNQLAQLQEAESEKESKLEEEARKAGAALRQWILDYNPTVEPDRRWEGEWIANSGISVRLIVAGDQLEANWSQDRYAYRAIGSARGTRWRARIEKQSNFLARILNPESPVKYEDSSNALLSLSTDGQSIQAIIYVENSATIEEWKRVSKSSSTPTPRSP